MEVEIEKVKKDGKEFLNFRSVSKLELLEKRIVALETKILKDVLPAPEFPNPTDKDYSEEYESGINPEDIPF